MYICKKKKKKYDVSIPSSKENKKQNLFCTK